MQVQNPGNPSNPLNPGQKSKWRVESFNQLHSQMRDMRMYTDYRKFHLAFFYKLNQ